MAYIIQCHIVEPEEEQIRVVVSFYGADEDEAQAAYDEYFEKDINLGKLEKEGVIVEEEGAIPDDEVPQVEEEEAPPEA